MSTQHHLREEISGEKSIHKHNYEHCSRRQHVLDICFTRPLMMPKQSHKGGVDNLENRN